MKRPVEKSVCSHQIASTHHQQNGRGEMDSNIPRRCDLLRNTPEELAIRSCVEAVERLGAHPLLTDTVSLLYDARMKLADWIDGGQP